MSAQLCNNLQFIIYCLQIYLLALICGHAKMKNRKMEILVIFNESQQSRSKSSINVNI